MTVSTKPIQQTPVVLVLVTDQMSCERLILAGRRLADQNNLPLEVLNVAKAGKEPNPQAIEHLYRISLQNEAVMTVEYCDEPERTLCRLLQKNLPQIVVTGMPGSGSTLLQRLWTQFEYLAFYTVSPEGATQPVTPIDLALA